jgi:methyl-coenzyme M reductase subunit D
MNLNLEVIYMDLEIFPYRILSADTTEKLVGDIEQLDGINRIVLQGQRLPPQEMGDPDRRVIVIGGEEVDLQVKTGRILMEIENEELIEGLKTICDKYLSFGYDIMIGTFIRKQKTVSDKIKYGETLGDVPEEMVGLTDQNAQLYERATVIKKKNE